MAIKIAPVITTNPTRKEPAISTTFPISTALMEIRLTFFLFMEHTTTKGAVATFAKPPSVF